MNDDDDDDDISLFQTTTKVKSQLYAICSY